MKISAQNILKGKVISIKEGAVVAKVVIEIADGIKITSVITLESVKYLDLKVSSQVYAIIKSTEVILGQVTETKISAQNVIKGKVISVKEGAVVSKVVMEIAGSEKITSVVTVESVNQLNIREGSEVLAIIKSTEVIIGV